MILDKLLEFSDAQAVTVTALSTNVVDLYPLGNQTVTNLTRDIGTGEDTYLVVQVGSTVTGAGTLTVTLETDDNVGMASPTVHFTSSAIAFGSLTAGTAPIRVKLPAGNYERYMAVRYTVAAGPFTGGTFDAFIVKDTQANLIYKSGFTVA